jgi:quercetin dioxygenase-like cupin family protein
MEISNWRDLEEVESRPGIFRKILTLGNLQIIQYRYGPGSVFEEHSHPEEQMTIILAGSLDFRIGGKEAKMENGDIAHIPGGVPHEAINNGRDDALTWNIYTPPKKGI